MNYSLSYILVTILSLILTYSAIKIFIKYSHKIQNYGEDNVFIVRNEKVPTSGGITIFFVFSISLTILFYLNNEHIEIILPNRYYLLIFSLFILFIISVYDDFNSIHPIYKLIAQIIIAYISVACLNLQEINFPLKIIILMTVIIWVYVMNIVNFIDGSDGFLTTYSLFFFSSIFLTQYFISEFNSISHVVSFILLPILLVFLNFNRPKAKLFMGDSGSIFLGYLIGFCSLEIVLLKYWKLGFILLMYPLLDCTLTLVLKIKKGHYPWARLFDYFFLGPIKKNNDHEYVLKVFKNYLIFNFILFLAQLKFPENFYIVVLSFISTVFVLVIYKKKS